MSDSLPQQDQLRKQVIDLCVRHHISEGINYLETLFEDDLMQLFNTALEGERVKARIEEITNAKVVHMDMHHKDKGQFDRWCTKRQEDIHDGKPAEYGYENTEA